MRIRTVEAAQPAQAADQVGHIRAEDAAVDVQLVDHDPTEILEQRRPARVVREDPGVEHVRVGQQQAHLVADRPALRGGRVAVVGAHRQLIRRTKRAQHVPESTGLILGQRLGGEQIDGAGVGIIEQRLQDRQVVAQRLARGGARHDHDVLPIQRSLHRRRLVRIERRGAALSQRSHQAGREPRRSISIARRPRREAFPCADVSHEGWIAAQPLEGIDDRHRRGL